MTVPADPGTPPRPLRAFAGVGSRSTPPDMLSLLRRASQFLVEQGWTCRTGGAEGADTACEQGALEALEDDLLVGPEHATHGALEVYLPWPAFGRGDRWYRQVRHRAHDGELNVTCLAQPTPEAVRLASTVHPAWAACSGPAQKLHGRNSHQVLGSDLRSPVSVVLCWTPDGADGTTIPVTRETGGTGQAIRLAALRKIPVLNLQQPAHRDRVLAKLPKDRI